MLGAADAPVSCLAPHPLTPNPGKKEGIETLPWTDRDWVDRHKFFRELPESLRPLLPSDLRDFTFRARGSLAQLHYQDPKIHYEAWFHWRSGRLELGLHFEQDQRTNERLFQAFDRQIVAIKAGLGESIELERWDRGWVRIYETWPCEKVDPPFRAHMTDRLAQMIAILQPWCDDFLRVDTQADRVAFRGR